MKTPRILIGIVALTTAMISCAKAQSSLTNGLVAYYTFDGNANDQSGNGNNASIFGATFTTDRFSITNGALMFNGVNNYVNATVTNQPLGNAPRTLTCWLKPADDRSEGGVVYQGQGNCTGHLFGIGTASYNSPRQIMFWGGCQDWASSLPLPTNQWSFVAITYDGAGHLTAYVNNSQQSANIGTLNTLSAHFWMGGETGNDGASFDYFYYGAMDNVRMYNRALSTNEVAQLYAIESKPPVQITQDLTNIYALYGHDTAISITATSSLPVNYQWYFIPADGSGQAGAYAQIISGFVYNVVVTNSGFGYGNIPSVSFVGGGGSGAGGYASISNGVVVGISVTNAGSGYTTPPAVAIGNPNGLSFGQTNSTFAISHANSSNVGSYYVVIGNAYESVTSSVVSLTLVYPPSININPIGFTGTYHSSNSLTAYATGTPPLSYQWFLNGTNISHATGNSYTIASLNLTNTGAYTVQVSNLYGTTSSIPAYVYLAPALTSPFAGAIGLWGQNTTLGVGAVGSGILSYQWYFNGAVISGATNYSYVLNNIQFTNAGLYSVVVSSPYGSVTNTAYQVVVNPAEIAMGTCPIIYINGTAGYSYTIQSTTDLSNTNAWITVTNITIPSSFYIWADTATDTSKPSNPRKFYRIIAGQ